MRRPRPRTLGIVCVCLVLLAAGVLTGTHWTQRWNGSVTLLANWSGAEKERFHEHVIEPFQQKYRIRVFYQGSSAQSQVLAADVAAGTPPDVVILPGPGELAAYAADDRLAPLDGLFDTDDYDAIWVPRVAGADGRAHTYWVPVKTDLKSMVWYPESLEEGEVARIARDPGQWCLAMESGATSGWPGTDWVEDVLLQQAGPRVYQDWAAGRLSWKDKRVRKAFTTWGELVGAGDGQRIEQVLRTNYGQAWEAGGQSPPACSRQRLEHQAAFVRKSSHWVEAGGRYVHSAAVIPDARRNTDTWEVSGDLAAMLNDTPQARRLIGYLTDPDTEPLDFTANKAVPQDTYGSDRVTRRIDATLRGPGPVRCWDASDAMPPAMRAAFHQAVLRFLAFPDELESQLEMLETVRHRKDMAWLPSVCGSG